MINWQQLGQDPSRAGFFVLVFFVVGLLLVIATIDFVFVLHRKPAIGNYVNLVVTRERWIAGVLALIFGMLIAHFFLHITRYGQ